MHKTPWVAKSSFRPSDRLSWLKPLLPQIMTGAIGLLGAVLGAGATGYVQLRLEHERAVQSEKQRRFDRAEEIITLIEKTPVTFLEAKKAMLLEPTHISSPPTDAERVIALVALYFPDASDAARSYEVACAHHVEMLSQIALSIVRHSPLPNDAETYQKMLTSGDIVTATVLGDVGVTYKPRVASPSRRPE